MFLPLSLATCVSYIASFPATIGALQSHRTQTYEGVKNMRKTGVPTTSLAREIVSLAECSKECLANNNVCDAFSFSSLKKMCRTHCLDGFTTGSLEEDSDWVYYEKYPSPTSTCPEGFQSHNGKCYYFDSVGATWSSAKEQCQQKCSKLVSVEAETEDLFIMTTLKAIAGSRSCYYTSGNDLQVHGTWVWDSTGQQMGSYAPWDSNQGPYQQSSSQENVHMYWKSSNFRWHDHSPTNTCGFICEK